MPSRSMMNRRLSRFRATATFRFGVPSAAAQGRVETMEILVVADRDACGLHQDHPKERVTLLRDLAEMVRIRRRVEGRRQADVAGDLLTSRKPADGPEDHARGKGRHRTDARMGEDTAGGRGRAR